MIVPSCIQLDFRDFVRSFVSSFPMQVCSHDVICVSFGARQDADIENKDQQIKHLSCTLQAPRGGAVFYAVLSVSQAAQ